MSIRWLVGFTCQSFIFPIPIICIGSLLHRQLSMLPDADVVVHSYFNTVLVGAGYNLLGERMKRLKLF